MREEIDWQHDITIKARMENFRQHFLHPHIFAQVRLFIQQTILKLLRCMQ